MSDAITRTNALGRDNLAVDQLFVNDLNPNQMSDTEFNLLHDNIERMGITDPILVRPMGDRYRIVGGAHRFEVAKLLGFTHVPCTIIHDPNFDDDQEKFQIVRHNVIKGKMTPEKFMRLYDSLGNKYTEQVLKDAFGFAEEAEFKKLLKQVEKNLPEDLKQTFKEASKNVKDIDDLSKILQGLFSKHGDSLPYGYLLIDFGGKESVWLRMEDRTRKAVYALGGVCRSRQRTMDDLVGGLIRLVVDGKLDEYLTTIESETKPVQIPSDGVELPTAEFLESLK